MNMINSSLVKMVVMKAGKCPSEALSLTNRVVLNSNDHAQFQQPKHIVVHFGGSSYPFSVAPDSSMPQGQVDKPLFPLVIFLSSRSCF